MDNLTNITSVNLKRSDDSSNTAAVENKKEETKAGDVQTQDFKIPWRYADSVTSFDCTVENTLREGIKKNFSTFRKTDGTGVKRANILLLGPVGAGKSSFLNSVATLCKQRKLEPARTWNSSSSLTVKLQKYYMDVDGMSNFCMYDTMGIECDDKGLHKEDIRQLVNGHVKRKYKFTAGYSITEDSKKYRANPALKDKMHCVVYVIDAEWLNGQISDTWTSKLEVIQDTLKESGVPQKLILTKIDKICARVSEDVSLTFKSQKIKGLIEKASNIFKLKRNDIHPIKNYELEMNSDYKINILTVLALNEFLQVANTYITEESQPDSDDERDTIVLRKSGAIREQSVTNASESF